MSASKGITGKVGRWSARHPWTAISLWIAFVATAVVIGGAVGTKKLTEAESASGESGVAARTLDKAGFKIQPGEQVLVQSKTLRAGDPAFRGVVSDVITRLEGTPNVVKLRSPYTQNTISRDGHSALVSFEIPGTFDSVGSKVAPIQKVTAAAQTAHPGFVIAEAGDGSFSKAYDDTQGKDFQKAEQLSLPITLLILIVAFGGLLIAGIPVALAMSAVVAAFGLTSVASQLLPVTDVTQSVILLIGLAVGVDYSIFYIARERQELARGAGKVDAIEIAAATSGRAVLVSGLTVMAAMSGMFLAGNSVFSGIALATILVVATAIIGSLTVLPALLAPKSAGILKRVPGHTAMGRGFRFVGRGIAAAWAFVTWPFRSVQNLFRRSRGETTFWQRVLRPVLKHPVISVIASSAILVALALPAANLKLGLVSADYGMSKSLPVMQAKAAIDKAFPGSPSPAVVVIEGRDVTSPQVTQAIANFEQKAIAGGYAFKPFTLSVSKDHSVARLYVPIKGDGHNAQAVASMKALRSSVVPQTLNSDAGVTAQVAGEAAGTEDFNQVMRDRAPLVIGFVLLMSFLLLLVTFRSLIIPIKAILLNLLSVGAAYGILVAVFQWGWGENLLNFESNGGITPWLPMFLFVILFGLSMDYHVFILSRVREAYDRGLSNEEAVEHGIRSTAGVVTSAATVMIGTFLVFAILPVIDMKEMGIGLAAAILIDATLIRAVLLPATMKLLGDKNWYLPKWLGWLPRLEHEAEAAPPEAQPLPHAA